MVLFYRATNTARMEMILPDTYTGLGFDLARVQLTIINIKLAVGRVTDRPV